MIKKTAKFLLVLALILLPTATSFAADSSTTTQNSPTPDSSDTPVAPFADVQVGNPNYLAIKTLKDDKILEGYDDNSFKPNQEITRAEALKIITVSTGKVIDDELNSVVLSKDRIFKDVPNDTWYAKYLSIAKAKNVIDGYPDGSFRPNHTINLVETLKMYMECIDGISYPDTASYTFADANLNSWYGKYVAYAANQELLDISEKNEIFPDQKMTRGDFAEIIYRLKLSTEKGYRFGKATFYGKAAQGHGTASGEAFDMNALTAAHKTLPFGTIVEVTDLSNGKTVEVKITDRGPFGPGRVLDLTSAAFEKLDSLGTGVIIVQYRPTDSI